MYVGCTIYNLNLVVLWRLILRPWWYCEAHTPWSENEAIIYLCGLLSMKLRVFPSKIGICSMASSVSRDSPAATSARTLTFGAQRARHVLRWRVSKLIFACGKQTVSSMAK